MSEDVSLMFVKRDGVPLGRSSCLRLYLQDRVHLANELHPNVDRPLCHNAAELTLVSISYSLPVVLYAIP